MKAQIGPIPIRVILVIVRYELSLLLFLPFIPHSMSLHLFVLNNSMYQLSEKVFCSIATGIGYRVNY